MHNAGASQHAAVEETSPAVAAALLQLNLAGPIAVASATLPHMVGRAAAGGGAARHVIVASMSAVVPSPGQGVYAAAKAGLRGYFHSLAAELADRGVGVSAECTVTPRGSTPLFAWPVAAARTPSGAPSPHARALFWQLSVHASMPFHVPSPAHPMQVTVCCPGPLATGQGGKPRMVYGPTGLMQQKVGGLWPHWDHAAEGGGPHSLSF